MEISLKTDKEKVMHEVAMTTAYTGAKQMDTDENAYERIATVDEDETELKRFWEESRAELCQELIGLVTFEGMVSNLAKPDEPKEPLIAETMQLSELPEAVQAEHYELRMDVSKSFDEALLPSMELSLRSFFVYSIVAKWYIYTNKGEAGEYADKAATLLDDIHRKAVNKKKPERPKYE